MQKPWFKHDVGARNSLKMQALIAMYKAEGYGIFWAIVEVLHEKKNKLPLKQYVFDAISDKMKINNKKVEKIIQTCIEIELFKQKKGFFSSSRVNRNITNQLAISKIRAKSGKRGAIAKQNLADVDVDVDVDKEIDVVEEREKKSAINNNAFFEMFRRVAGSQISDTELISEIGKFKNRYPNVHPNQAGALINTWVANIGKPPVKKVDFR